MQPRIIAAFRSLPPRVADALLAAALAAFALFELLGSTDLDPLREPRHAAAVAIALAETVPLAWRRRRPDLAIMIAGLAGLVMGLATVPGTFGGGFGIMAALYSVVAHGSDHEARGAGAVTAVVLAIIAASLWDVLSLAEIVTNYVLFGTAWALGYAARNRRLLLAELRVRAEEAESNRALEAQRAAVAERARIARELHDVVAHTVSVMVVQAGAARRVVERSPDEARRSLAVIEETGRAALSELRRLLGVLRAGDEDLALAPQPTLAALGGLVDTYRAAGLPITLEVDDLPADLPPGVDVSAYRIIQEALTNVLKHAGPVANVEVKVNGCAGGIDVEVVDDGQGGTPSRDGHGHGLVGMRERALLYGGRLDAGTRRRGGFRVRARLPLAGAVDRSADV